MCFLCSINLWLASLPLSSNLKDLTLILQRSFLSWCCHLCSFFSIFLIIQQLTTQAGRADGLHFCLCVEDLSCVVAAVGGNGEVKRVILSTKHTIPPVPHTCAWCSGTLLEQTPFRALLISTAKFLGCCVKGK